MIAVCLCRVTRFMICRFSKVCKNATIVLFDFFHLLQRKATEAIIWPRCRTKRCESCMTFSSFSFAMSSRSNHHLSRSASCHSQWSVISRLIFIQPDIVVGLWVVDFIIVPCCTSYRILANNRQNRLVREWRPGFRGATYLSVL